MKGILPIVTVLVFAAVGGCRRGEDREPGPMVAEQPVDSDPVMAVINGLPVLQSDFVAALQSGRLGGTPEWILDEMLSFTLVLQECEAMGAGRSCSGPDPAHVRALGFLERIYPVDKVCGDISKEDFDRTFSEIMKTGRAMDPDPSNPSTRELIEGRICEARSKRIKRLWVTALRKGASVDIRSDAVRNAIDSSRR